MNSSPPHTDAMRNLPLFASSLKGRSTVLPCYCIGFHVLLWESYATPLLVDWCHGWVGWGAKIFSRSRLARRTLHMQPAVLKVLHWNLSVWCRTRAGWWRIRSLLLQAQCRQSLVRSGAALCCWLGLWLHTALLCCNGPCPHDPREMWLELEPIPNRC